MDLQIPWYAMHFPDHVVALVICILAPILAYSSRNVPTEEISFEPGEKINLYHGNALLLIVFSLVVVTIWRLPGRTLEALGIAWPSWSPIVTSLLIIICLLYILDLFFQYGLQRWRDKTLEHRQASLNFIPADRKEWLHFIFLAIAAGIGEEIIFRGFLIHYLIFWTGNAPMGIYSAGLFSSALFAFLHGYQGVKSMIKILALAILFTAIFLLTRSLLLVIILHILIDILSGYLGFQLIQQIQQEKTPED